MARLERAGRAVHVATLVLAAGVLVHFARGQWFWFDEWDFLTLRGIRHAPIGLFQPHNEHWSTVPILVYRALGAAVGLHHYLPYLAVVFVLHLTAAHLLWRIMRRGGVAPLVAAAAAGVFALLGAGYENLLWAFQMGFVASLTLGLAHVLLVSGPG